MEEDAGKSMHDSDDPYSYIDLNRAGVPLLEIVSEPDLRSAEEVDAYMTAMRQLVRYLNISDGNMQEGSMRCDCNVSVRRKGVEQLGERCEIKNLNSMRYARRAIAYEVKRQIDLLESGGQVRQQTLNFDPVSGATSPLRDKEDAHDYRYFPEPDLPPISLDESYVSKIREHLPALPWELYERLQQEYGLSDYDANLITTERASAEYFLQLTALAPAPKSVANLMINKLLPYCQEEQIDIDQFPVSIPTLGQFLQLIEEGQVSNTVAYQNLLPELIKHPNQSPLELAKSLQLIQNKDEDFLAQLVDEVIAGNPDKVKAYQNGKKGLLGFFMGEVMKRSKGQAEPKATNNLLRARLE
jgi:aspartyl-tRNA(Asn)/glutamyl-tRNA(Gln) amidotransferase subunit B